ncbi:ubiquitin-like small modifier protein 1 [Chloroflexota bacterium]
MRVRLFGTLRDAADAKEITLDLSTGTVRSMLDGLRSGYPELAPSIVDTEGNLKRSVHVLVNGRSIRFLEGLDTPVCADDRLAIFPAVGGG